MLPIHAWEYGHPLNHGKPSSGYILKIGKIKTEWSFQPEATTNCQLVFNKERCLKTFHLTYERILAGLIYCRCCRRNHRCSEFIVVLAIPCTKKPEFHSPSINSSALPLFLPPTPNIPIQPRVYFPHVIELVYSLSKLFLKN